MTAEPTIVTWGPERVAGLTGLWRRCAPGESISEDEFVTALWGPDAEVLGTLDDRGVIAASTRTEPDGTVVGWIRLVAVDPEVQRQGLATALVGAAEAWLRSRSVVFAGLGDEAPPYLWPGVDLTNVGAQCLAEACGSEPVEATFNMALPVTFRAEPPEGMVVRRLTDDPDVEAVRAMVERNWDVFLPEFDLGVEGASVFATFSGDDPVGFCAHSVGRIGWLGPMGTDPAWGGRGIGASLVSAVCTDLMVAGLSSVEVCRVGPVRFYASLGAVTSRTFRTLLKAL